MQNQRIKTVVIISAILLLGACTSTPPTEEPIEDKAARHGFTIGKQVKKINNFQINSWNMVDRKSAILYVGASRRYLVTTRNPCDGLADTGVISYSTTAGSLTEKDKLLMRRSPAAERIESCFIDAIYELEKIKN